MDAEGLVPFINVLVDAAPLAKRAHVSAAAPRKQKLTREMRSMCWAIYYSPTSKTEECLVCQKNRINTVDRSGFECGHIIPEKYNDDRDIEPHFLIPMCRTCNSSMGTKNAFNYLIEKASDYDLIQRICATMYRIYVSNHAARRSTSELLCMWRHIENISGSIKFPNGGGIFRRHEPMLYNVLLLYETEMLQRRITQHMKQVAQVSTQLVDLMRRPFKPRDDDEIEEYE